MTDSRGEGSSSWGESPNPGAYPSYPEPSSDSYPGSAQPPYPPTGYYATAPRTNGKAIASLVLALVSFVLPVGFITGPLAVIFGHIGRGEISRRGEGGNGLAVAGLITGYLVSIFWLLLIVGLAIAASSGQLG